MQINELVTFAADVGRGLLESGAETSRVEDTVERIIRHFYDGKSEVLVVMTGLFVTVGDVTKTVRVRRRTINLDKVSKINMMSRDIADDKIDFEEALKRFEYVMAQKYDLTDIGNALSRVMDNPMTKIIRSGIGVLGVVNPVAGIVGGIGNDLLSEYNTFKLGHLLNGLASGFNLERRLNELYNYVNSSPEKAIIVANLFKQTVNAECPKVCVIYGLILANHLETLTEFTHEELIVCKALENATDYDLKNFKEIMENYLKPTSNGRRIVFPKDFADIAAFTTTCDWCVYNRIFVSRTAEWGEMEEGVLDMSTYYYEANPASVLLDNINAARQTWNYG